MSAESTEMPLLISGECILRNMQGKMEEKKLAPYEARVMK
jgi:hypothetical protein